MTTATIKLWGTTIGYVSMNEQERFARFEYDPDFVKTGIELAPLMMPPKERRIYQFPELHPRAFHGLPGLLADSLPDKYGNRLIDIWLAKTGRDNKSFNAVDRLCYTGTRGMGALEFEPSLDNAGAPDKQLQIDELVELASMAFADKKNLKVKLDNHIDDQELFNIISLGTSAGGARAKAVVGFDPHTSTVRSGQLDLPNGYEHWLIKFDGVQYNGDWGVADPAGYGLLEYSYYQMAQRCQISMTECRLFSENGRHHFMTKRFDRDDSGGKQFVQTLGALAHFDYWESGHYSYEQLFMTLRRLRLPQSDIEQQYRRTVFNLVGANQDDHVKNFACIMNRQGDWRLSPAYDLCHAQGSDFTKNHQLSINGKTNEFEAADLKHLADYAGLPRGRYKRILDEVVDTFKEWPRLAQELKLPQPLQTHVIKTLRLEWR